MVANHVLQDAQDKAELRNGLLELPDNVRALQN